MAKAFSPREVAALRGDLLPDFVLDTWNRLLASKYTSAGRPILVTQEEAIQALLPHTSNGSNRQEVFDKGWLDIEDFYRREGWKVEYDKPGYNESYRASYTFKQ